MEKSKAKVETLSRQRDSCSVQSAEQQATTLLVLRLMLPLLLTLMTNRSGGVVPCRGHKDEDAGSCRDSRRRDSRRVLQDDRQNTFNRRGAGAVQRHFSTLMGVAPERALLIGMNQAMREATLKHQDPQGRLPIGLELASGGLAGLAQVLFSAPKEMIMIQMQLASQGAETGVVAGAQASPLAVIKQLGLRGLYAGSSATALREIPFAACYFTAYSQLKGRLLEDRAKLSFLETLGCATVAAAPPAVLVTPADVIKTNMQAQAQGDAAPLSLMAQGKSIVQEGGVRALFVGATPRALMKAPQFGIALLVVETLKDLANPPHSQAR